MLKINLYPGRKRRILFKAGSPKLKFEFPVGDRAAIVFLSLVAVVLVLSAVSYFYKKHTIRKLDEAIAVAVADSIRYAESIKLYDEIKEREGWIRNRISVIQMVDQNRYLWSELMSGINDVMPTGTWMTRLETLSPFPNLVFKIEGISFSNIEVANFMRKLEKLKYIDEVKLISTKEHLIEEIPTMAFTIECSLGRKPIVTAEAKGGKGKGN